MRSDLKEAILQKPALTSVQSILKAAKDTPEAEPSKLVAF